MLPDLCDLTDRELDALPAAITEAWNRRLRERLRPGMLVRTIQSGFDGGAGRVCVFQKFVIRGEGAGGMATYGDDYACFGNRVDGEVLWLVDPDRLGEYIRIVEEKG